VVYNWLKIPILFSFEYVVVGSSVDNQTQVLMQALLYERGFTKKLVGKKLMTFSAKGVSISQSTMSSVTK
jgi:hypothetical protein